MALRVVIFARHFYYTPSAILSITADLPGDDVNMTARPLRLTPVHRDEMSISWRGASHIPMDLLEDSWRAQNPFPLLSAAIQQDT